MFTKKDIMRMLGGLVLIGVLIGGAVVLIALGFVTA